MDAEKDERLKIIISYGRIKFVHVSNSEVLIFNVNFPMESNPNSLIF